MPKPDERCVTGTGNSSLSATETVEAVDQRSIVASKLGPPEGSDGGGAAFRSGCGIVGAAFTAGGSDAGLANETPSAAAIAVGDRNISVLYHICGSALRDREDA